MCHCVHSHDDIQDNSSHRRSLPTAHSIYGVASTINASNYGMFQALDCINNLNHPEATAVFAQQMLQVYHGLGMDIYWRDNYLCPSEEEYREMAVASKYRSKRWRYRDFYE